VHLGGTPLPVCGSAAYPCQHKMECGRRSTLATTMPAAMARRGDIAAGLLDLLERLLQREQLVRHLHHPEGWTHVWRAVRKLLVMYSTLLTSADAAASGLCRSNSHATCVAAMLATLRTSRHCIGRAAVRAPAADEGGSPAGRGARAHNCACISSRAAGRAEDCAEHPSRRTGSRTASAAAAAAAGRPAAPGGARQRRRGSGG
jgi:hypothetical protein